MKTTQSPITTDDELACYHIAADQLCYMIERHETTS